MGKRKRGVDEGRAVTSNAVTVPCSIPEPRSNTFTLSVHDKSTTIQIIAGSYDRVLHGISATITPSVDPAAQDVQFADTFLFNAHASAIRCLALSPLPSSIDASQKLILASGGTDERINLYHISASTSNTKELGGVSLPSLGSTRVLENPKNRELGSLLHHSASITALYFPTRSKLLSAAEDSTIAISRTRDWTVLASIKAPIPKAVGRPSGDTAPLGGTPAGVNDFAVHPSMKLMISVGKGEKCMRLWNLVTGKKAGVLTFEKEILKGVGEGKWGSGEGRKVEWNSEGDEFVVGFEKGAVVFGMDSRPRCRVIPSPLTKIHQIHYVTSKTLNYQGSDVLAVSTEDGRVIFYSTSINGSETTNGDHSNSGVPTCTALGQLGGKSTGLTVRIKDFEILAPAQSGETTGESYIVTGSSDGSIRIWALERNELNRSSPQTGATTKAMSKVSNGDVSGPDQKQPVLAQEDVRTQQIGKVIGAYMSGNRITCLKAFIMIRSGHSLPDEEAAGSLGKFEGIDDSEHDSSNGIKS